MTLSSIVSTLRTSTLLALAALNGFLVYQLRVRDKVIIYYYEQFTRLSTSLDQIKAYCEGVDKFHVAAYPVVDVDEGISGFFGRGFNSRRLHHLRGRTGFDGIVRGYWRHPAGDYRNSANHKSQD